MTTTSRFKITTYPMRGRDEDMEAGIEEELQACVDRVAKNMDKDNAFFMRITDDLQKKRTDSN